MSNAIIYNSDGKILRSISAPPDILQMQVQPGESLILGTADLTKQYVNFDSVTDRPIQPTIISSLSLSADGIDSVTLSSVPSGTFTAINKITKEQVSGVISGTDTFSTTVSGFYLLRIVSWPYLDFEVTVHAI